ncbi:Ribonuclease H-like superfamily [Arabidopsis suecica]|uniref:Ribonuclease H-like superfamily n=1 Tax=Arabidopsis suecica TaxID=45249 RepID=A0A8T1ZW96_ARASU|nr:Ribonuclease H-like superfamily [Arabidopsis suecica]
MALANQTAQPTHKTISPFDLTSSDNPDAVISFTLLNGSNYDEWAINFRMALSSRKKFGLIDGSIAKPTETDATFADWTAYNHLLVGWIKETIEPKIRSSFSTREVAKELWDIIKKRFSVKSGGQCMSSKQCTCGKCECDLNTSRDKKQKLLQVHDFLSGLDDSIHGVIRSQICAVSRLPDLDTVYQTIVQNETIRSANTEPSVMSFASQLSSSAFSRNSSPILPQPLSRPSASTSVNSTRPFNRDPSRQCTGCGRSGHDASSCFKVIGYPELWGDRPRYHNDSRGRGRGTPPRANSTHIMATNTAALPSGTPLSNADHQGLSNLMDDQWKVVQRLVATSKMNEPLSGKIVDVLWNLDTGATHHMTGDRGTRTLTGIGEREGEGLYHFRGVESLISSKTSVQVDSVLWHNRLGHPSSQAFGMIPGVNGLSSRNSELLISQCDVCFRAKQTRQSFPDSSNNAIGVFDLIHCDLWGPYRTTSFCGFRYFLTIVDDHSRAIWIYLLKDKASVSRHLQEFLALVERQFSRKVKAIRSDNAPEYSSNDNRSIDLSQDRSIPENEPKPEADRSIDPGPDRSIPDRQPCPEAVRSIDPDTDRSIPTTPVHDSAVVRPVDPVPDRSVVHSVARPVPPAVVGQSSTSTQTPPAIQASRHSERPKNPPVRLQDYIVGTVSIASPSSSSSPTPQLSSKITALERNHTWDLVELPPNKKALGNRWVFKIKYWSDGTIERFKARLVALGNHQKEGIDYTDTFSLVAKMKTVCVFLDFAVKKNHEVHQMDVHNTFLHVDLHKEVYMKLPQGFSSPTETRVCRLRKSLYGLKQAPRCWFAKLADSLLKCGFFQTRPDYSLFVYNKHGISLRILVYVDDLIISGNSPSAIQEFKDYLSTCFYIKDLGLLKYFLGLEVARSPAEIYLCQRKYASDIVTEVGLLGCKLAGSPLDQNQRLALATGPVLEDPSRYRCLVGRLIYLAAIRPDLAYAVHLLSQFMQSPKEEYWLVSLKLGSSPISWKTKKQDTASLSSAKAEYRAMNAITKELMFLKNLLFELGVDQTGPMTICCDSKPAIHISTNPVFHERTKHIELDCHFVRDQIVAGAVKPFHVSTEDQLADILTKALGRKEFDDFLHKLGICDLHAPT